MTRAEALDIAKEIVCKDRNEQYGEPEDSFETIGELWAQYIKRACASCNAEIGIGARDVAIMMCLFKIARIATSCTYEPQTDSIIDLIGYAACAAGIECKDIDFKTYWTKGEQNNGTDET